MRDPLDLTLPVGNEGFVNIRVGAIITRGDKFLMVENLRDPYLYSVGGRIRFGESAEEAVIREVFEETGVRLEIERLGFIVENFFPGMTDDKRGRQVYEIGFYFYMKTPENFEPRAASLTEDGICESLVWVGPDCEKRIFPTFFRTEIGKTSGGVRHIVERD